MVQVRPFARTLDLTTPNGSEWSGSGSERVRTFEPRKYICFFLQMLNTTAIPPIHLLKSSPGVREALLAVHHSLNISDSSIYLHEFVCMCFNIPNRLASCVRQGPSPSWISTKDHGSEAVSSQSVVRS